MLIEQVYEHDHECAWKGREVRVRCMVDDGVYYPAVPRCVETLTELRLVDAVMS